jgi:hypothetical protein
MRATLGFPARQGNEVSSLRRAASALRLGAPISFRDLVLEPVKLAFPLNAVTCSGSCEVTLSRDGTVHFTGRVHDSGALAASYVVIVSFPTLTDHTSFPPEVLDKVGALGPVVMEHKGHVGGTLSFDTRDSTWDKTATKRRIADFWIGVKAAAGSAKMQFGVGTGAVEMIDAVLSGATGLFVFSL